MLRNVLNLVVVLALLFSTIPALASPDVAPAPRPSEQSSSLPASQNSGPQPANGFIVSDPVLPADTTGLPPAPPAEPYKGDDVFVPNEMLPKAQRLNNAPHTPDPAVQSTSGPVAMPTPIMNWEGIGNTGVQPPDTDGQVGPNHYIQIVNAASTGSQIRIWDKSGNQLYDFGMNGMWPAGDRCNQYGYGDPVVLYDQLADRWLLTQFIYPPSGPYSECIAVSKTGTPTNNPSDWWLYNFVVSTNNFPDYPKFGVWPDGYYMMAHQFLNASTWNGTGVWVFDRDKMLNGQAATFQYKDLYPMNPNYGGMLPSNLMGNTLPPAGSPNYFVEVDQDWSGTDDVMTVFAFHVDWATPANTSFTVVGSFVVNPFDMDLCSASRERCIDQPGRPLSLEAISDRLMMHLWYRNFGDHEALVTNHTVDGDGAGHAGIRWYELRKTTPAPTAWMLYQQGTYFPTSDHRWMGSIAMDHVGNIALGYSVSSLTTYPSIRYAGRLPGDPLGTLAQGEASLVEGGGSFSGYRWGDYSAMSVDPVDDCTFWYTQEYVETGQTSWSTRIGSFKFPNCAIGPQGVLAGTVTNSSGGAPISGATILATASVTQSGSAQSGAGGTYALNLLAGSYVVTGTAYGFLPKVYLGITINQNATTTLNIALDPAPSFVVSGTVRDALAGWPLYARLTIGGYPGAPIWTDPATGFYSITLVGGTTYNFNVTSASPGYQAASQSVGPLMSNMTVNIGLNVDQAVCTAPGYELQVTGVYEPFNATTAPPGWSAVNHGGACQWTFNDPGGRGNLTGGSGNFAVADSDICGSGTTMSTTLFSPIMNVSALSTLNLSFNYDYYNLSSSEHAAVDVSANGGTTWTNLFSWNSSHRGPAEYSQDVTALLGGSTQAQIRFRYYAPGWDWWWEVDNVFMGQKACVPKSGGLVVGNVSDVNNGQPLNGTTVNNQGGYSTSTIATPADPNVADGFYTLFSPAGSQVFTATKTGYRTETATVSVPLSSTVRQNFSLGAGMLSYTPGAFNVSLLAGLTSTLPMTLNNTGNLAATFEIQEGDLGGVPLMPSSIRPPYKARVSQYWDPTETMRNPQVKGPGMPPAPLVWGTGAPIPTGARYRAAGASCDGKTYYVFGGQNASAAVLNETWLYDATANTWTSKAAMPVALMSMEAVCLDGYIYLVGGYTGSAHTNQFQIYNTATNTWVNSTWPNIRTPMTAVWNGKLYAFGGNPGPSAETWSYDPATTLWTGPLAAMPTATSYGGATTMGDYIYVVGGGATGAAQRYNPAANTWSSGPALPATRMNPMLVWYGDRLYAASGGGVGGDIWAAYNDTYWLDTSAWPGGSWTLQGETVLQPVVAAAHDCVNNRIYGAGGTTGGSYFATNQYLDDGQTCHVGGAGADVPWVSESPITGTITSLSSQVVNVTFDSTVVDPGVYKAGLKFKNNTPYPVPDMPLTLTVTVPPTWGKLMGKVSTLGYCDASPAALKNVTVTVQSAAGTVYLKTDQNGNYAKWFDTANNPFTVTVNVTDYEAGLATGVNLVPLGTTTWDFNLRLLKPCLSATPTSFTVDLSLGQSTTRPFKLTNAGAATAVYSMTEQHVSGPAAPTPFYGAALPGTQLALNPNPPTAQVNQAVIPAAPAALISITHSASQQIVSGNSVSCNAGGLHTDNSYLRVFDLPSFGLGGPLNITKVQVGIETATAGSGGTQPATVKLYTLSGPLAWANLTSIGSAPVSVANQSLTILDMPVTAVAPAGAKLVVEFFTPSGQAAGHSLFVGSNSAGQTGPSYLAAASCGATEPTDVASLGFPNMHIVMNVWGNTSGGGADVPWVSEIPVSGTVPADTFANTTLVFDANAVPVPGTYKANVNVNSNDPVNPSRQANLTLNVSAPANWGVLTGTISSLGRCDLNPAPLAGATVVAQGSTGITRTVTTDGSGRYTLWLDSLTSPYSINVTADQHLPGGASGIVINGLGVVTQQNLSLRAIKPCVLNAPNGIAVTVPWQGGISRTLTLSNTGAASSLFTVTEQTGGFIPMAPVAGTTLVVNNDSTATRAFTTALTNLSYAYLVTTTTSFNSATVTALLTYDAVIFAGPLGSGTSATKAMAYMDAGGRFLAADNDLAYSWRNTAPGPTNLLTNYFQATYGADAGSDGPITGVDLMAGVNTDISSDPYPDSVTISGSDASGIFTNITPGTWAGLRIERAGYRAIYLAWDYQHAGGSSAVGEAAETAILQKAMPWLITGFFDAVPWVSENPTNGSLAANGGLQNVDVIFNANVSAITQPGTYYAALRIKNDDAVRGAVVVPITMTVLPQGTQGKLNGTVTGLGYCDVNPAALNNASVLIQGGAGVSTTLTTNAAGYYQLWLDAGTYTVTASMANYQTFVATGVIVTGTLTTTQNLNLRWLRPCVGVTPSSLSANLMMGLSTTLPMTLTNTGVISTPFALRAQAGGFIPMGPQPNASGGPDAFGYTFKDSNEAGGPTYAWIDATDGTTLTLPGDDDEANITLPFAFQYYGTAATALRVGKNGAALYNATTGEVSFSNVAMSSAPDNLLALMWDDQGAAGYVYWKVVGSAPNRKVVIEWYNVPRYVAVGAATYEMVLHENGNIVFQYLDVDYGDALYNGGASATVGIRGAGSTNSLQYSYNTAALTNGLAICFAYPGLLADCSGRSAVPWLSENPTQGVLNADTGAQQIAVTFDASVPEVNQPGTYYATLKAATNDPTYPSRSVPVTMTVGAPANWGKLIGTVNTLGACSVNTATLANAQVVITGGATPVTLTTNSSGAFSYWLAAGAYTLNFSAAEHQGATAPVMVYAVQTTTQNVYLTWIKPCASASPMSGYSDSFAYGSGLSATHQLVITNTGAGALNWNMQEKLVTAPQVERQITEKPQAAQTARSVQGGVAGFSAPIYSPIRNTPVLTEGFEGGVMPPTGWTRVITNPSYTWKIMSTSPHSGSYAADVEYDPLLVPQDEWLLSPQVDIGNGVLSFWSMGSLYWCRDTYDNCDLEVWLVVGGLGGGDDVYVGQGETVWPANWTWAQSVFTLTPLLPGGPVRIGFRYVGVDGAQVGLDDISLDGGTGGVCSPNSVQWLSTSPVSGTTASGGTSTVNVTVDSTGVSAGVHSAKVCIQSNDPLRPTIEVPFTLNITGPDVVVNKTGPATSASNRIVYRIAYTNTGTTAASSVTMVDTLPAGVTYVASSPSGVYNAGTVTWNLGSLAVGANGTLVVTTTRNTGLPVGTVLTNTATATVTPQDTNVVNNTSVVTTLVLPTSFVGDSTKTVDRGTAIVGSVVTYTIVLVNSGNVTSTVNLLDPLPTGAVYVLGSSTVNGSPVVLYNDLMNRIEYHGSLGPGASVTIRFRATITAPAGTTVTNVASVDDGVNPAVALSAGTLATWHYIFLPIVIN